MWQHRVIYLFALISLSLYYVMYPHWISWYLWVLILLLLPFDLLVSLPGMLARRIDLASPDTLELGETGQLTVTTLSKNPLLSGLLKVLLHESGEYGDTYHRFRCEAGRGSKFRLEIDTSQSDILHYSVRRLSVCSLVGLIALPVRVDCKAAVVVLPQPVRPPNFEPQSVPVRLFPKPGGGFSEEHDLRPYRLGDPVKMMHWKLSAKHDSLIVREALAPITLNRLISTVLWDGPVERDVIIGRLRWCSAHLLGQGFVHYVRIGERGTVMPIAHTQDLTDFLYKTLVGASLPLNTFSPTYFTWVLRIDAKRVAG